MSYILRFTKNGGFSWQFWNVALHFVYAKRRNMKFYLDDTQYLFKWNLGWNDYFDSVEIYKGQAVPEPLYFTDTLNFNIEHNITLAEYKEALDFITRPTEALQQKIEDTFNTFSIQPGEYDSVFIRRGDKMFSESELIQSEVFIQRLIDRGSTKIYVQTDDYSVIDEIKSFLQKNHSEKNIQIFSLCPPWKRGTVCYKDEYSMISEKRNDSRNKDYAQYLVSNHTQCVEEFAPEKMKEHCEEMVLGFELCIQSRLFVCDFQSNVSRYLYTRFGKPENAIILLSNKIPNFDTTHVRGLIHDFGL